MGGGRGVLAQNIITDEYCGKGVEVLGKKGFGVVGVNSKDFYKETPD